MNHSTAAILHYPFAKGRCNQYKVVGTLEAKLGDPFIAVNAALRQDESHNQLKHDAEDQ